MWVEIALRRGASQIKLDAARLIGSETMKKIGAFEAKNRLGELLKAAENGEEIMITKHGRPVAKLVPVKEFDRAKAREAVEWFKKFRETHSLGGLTYRELIDSGRKY